MQTNAKILMEGGVIDEGIMLEARGRSVRYDTKSRKR
jgi:hypothetical protein